MSGQEIDFVVVPRLCRSIQAITTVNSATLRRVSLGRGILWIRIRFSHRADRAELVRYDHKPEP